MTSRPHKLFLFHALGGLPLVFMGMLIANTAVGADKYCLDYFSVGDSQCQATESTPVARPQSKAVAAPQLVPPQSEVDKFLENYGKPPREFVEFYVHPTAENAAKWAAAYQAIVEKGKVISKAWNQADQLYQSPSDSTQAGQPALGITAVPATPAVSSPVGATLPVAPVATSFGGLTDASAATAAGPGGVRMSPVKLTYYFSQICPYCARMTPDLAVISKEKASTLTLTCVDVTPIGPQSRPDEAFITSKLPCKWRLPDDGEVDQQAVRLTPTLLIEKEGAAPVRLSGYVPLAQLRQYF